MASVHEQHEYAHHGPGTLPASLLTPSAVSTWRLRLLIASAAFAILSLVLFIWTPDGRNHLLRAYLHGFMTCFGFCGGGLALLMVQYVSGGKWGLLLRRPLEAMTRTLPLIALFFLPIGFLMKHLYQWAAFPTVQAELNARAQHLVTDEQALTAIAKYSMLNPVSVWVQSLLIFGIMGIFVFLLNKWSLQRDADPMAGTERSYNRWQVRFENLSGPGIFIYVVLVTAASIDWIKSLDVTWYSSIYGLQFLVGQGYSVLALSVLVVILLSRFEPMKTLLRTTEQHDIGKLMFAFTMLNIYFTFAEFLIIWSGNVPDEIPWYLARIHGGWWTICTLDVVCHWLIPFCFLLSRDLKRSKAKMIWLCCFMIFARCVDMFWLIEPNFGDSAGHLHFGHGGAMLAYVTVPPAVICLWGWYFLGELMKRSLVNTNDPHLEEMLEPEHAH